MVSSVATTTSLPGERISRERRIPMLAFYLYAGFFVAIAAYAIAGYIG